MKKEEDGKNRELAEPEVTTYDREELELETAFTGEPSGPI